MYRLIPSRLIGVKHVYSIVMGIIFIQWIYGPYWIHSLISSAVTYALCAFGPRKYFHLICFVWVIGYMTACHAYFMVVAYKSDALDHTGLQMVLTMKLSSFAYNLFDGTVGIAQEEAQGKILPRVLADRKRFAIAKLPSLLEFFGYVYCFPCLLTGPAFEYAEYIRVVDYSVFLLPTGASKTVKFESPFSFRWLLYAGQQFLLGTVFLVIFIKGEEWFPVSALWDSSWLSSHPSLVGRFFHLWMSIAGKRGRLYFCFLWAEAACVLAGFGFEGYDLESGRVKGFKGAQNSDIFATETAADVQALTRSWNKRTQGWLERYTYHRTGKSLYATYFVSALWHGLYPGWFLFFLSIPIITQVDRLMKDKVNPILIPEYDGRNWLSAFQGKELGSKVGPGHAALIVCYWFVCWFCAFGMCIYVVMAIFSKDWDTTMMAWGEFHHAGHLLLLLAYCVLVVLPSNPKKLKSPNDKKTQ